MFYKLNWLGHGHGYEWHSSSTRAGALWRAPTAKSHAECIFSAGGGLTQAGSYRVDFA